MLSSRTLAPKETNMNVKDFSGNRRLYGNWLEACLVYYGYRDAFLVRYWNDPVHLVMNKCISEHLSEKCFKIGTSRKCWLYIRKDKYSDFSDELIHQCREGDTKAIGTVLGYLDPISFEINELRNNLLVKGWLGFVASMNNVEVFYQGCSLDKYLESGPDYKERIDQRLSEFAERFGFTYHSEFDYGMRDQNEKLVWKTLDNALIAELLSFRPDLST
jgi:hypothetical protein